jgi:hypothetical protein
MRIGALRLVSLLGLVFVAACSTTAYTNKALDPQAPAPTVRATFKVDGKRGNPRVLTYLALSGGGSRSAYFSSAVMLNLQTVFPDIDLLEEVDVISSVSGGSLAAAFYAGTQDRVVYDQELAARVALLAADSPLAKKIGVADAKTGAVGCTGVLTDAEAIELNGLGLPPKSLDRVSTLCASRATGLRYWEPKSVREGMGKDYLLPWFGRWFLPTNFVPYWFSSLDRSDVMAQTFASNLFSKGLFNTDLKMVDLNPARPYLLVNATAATQREAGDPVGREDPPFGTTFTFTAEDFGSRLGSRIDDYTVARAVMGSSAFPVVFQNMTLADFRPGHGNHCRPGWIRDICSTGRYFHIFDGGNSDNLGLHSVKRSILERAMAGDIGRDYDAVVVILVDAITESKGADRYSPDPRSLLSLLADLNVTDAVDALLKGNHDKMVSEFTDIGLGWESPCLPDVHNLPQALCDQLRRAAPTDEAARELKDDINKRLIFVHIGFDNVLQVPGLAPADARALLDKANAVSTSFNLHGGEESVLQEHADRVVAANNPCLLQLRAVYLQERPAPGDVAGAKASCRGSIEQDPLKTKAPLTTAAAP